MPSMGDTQRLPKPCRRRDRRVLRDKAEPHFASLAKNAAVFFKMLRSAPNMPTSLRSAQSQAASASSVLGPEKRWLDQPTLRSPKAATCSHEAQHHAPVRKTLPALADQPNRFDLRPPTVVSPCPTPVPSNTFSRCRRNRRQAKLKLKLAQPNRLETAVVARNVIAFSSGQGQMTKAVDQFDHEILLLQGGGALGATLRPVHPDNPLQRVTKVRTGRNGAERLTMTRDQ